jgi:hypothetical protein
LGLEVINYRLGLVKIVEKVAIFETIEIIEVLKVRLLRI